MKLRIVRWPRKPTVWGEAQTLATEVPNAVVMLQRTCSDDEQVLLGVNESLTNRGVTLKWPNAQFATWNG